ncbi:MAG: TolC family protein [Cytophagaceae bacterium]|jgi:cobalt-zinc-cadmium resistance protein CzcA|nr:TolC family protein [Cytophagaceae bacterium]
MHTRLEFSRKNKRTLIVFILSQLFLIHSAFAQSPLYADSAVARALVHYPQLKVSNLQVEQQTLLKPAGFNLYSPELLFQSPTGDQMRLGIMQRFDFPTLYCQQMKLQSAAVGVSETQRDITVNYLKYSVRNSFIEFQYWYETQQILKRFDSILSDLVEINEVRYRVGQISNLEKINGEAKYKNLRFTLLQAEAEVTRARKQILVYMGNLEDSLLVPAYKMKKLDSIEVIEVDSGSFYRNPLLNYYQKQIEYNQRLHKVERHRSYPGLVVGYLNQAGPNTETQYRLQYGITLPIWYWQYNARIRAAKKGIEVSEAQARTGTFQLNSEYYQAQARYRQYSDGLKFYEQAGLLQAAEVLKSAATSYRLGSIGYYAYLMNIEQAFTIERNYLEALKNYNQSILYVNYLKGEL